MSKDIRIPLQYSDISCHQLFACAPPKTLFHYTNYNGANGIIESNSLRLTKFSYLNDSTELNLAINLFKIASTNKAKTIENLDKKIFLEDTAKQLDSFRNTNICVASFCEDGDLLSQWRSYGNNGNGVALAFDSQNLSSISKQGKMNLWKCIYLEEEHHRVIRGLIDILLRSYDLLIQSDSHETIKRDLIGYFNTTFLRVAPILKNSNFHEEKEWRLVTTSQKNTNPNWFSLVSNDRVSQYYQLRFNEFDCNASDLLKGIKVGPTQKPSLVSESLGILLQKNGFLHTERSTSKIPYQG